MEHERELPARRRRAPAREDAVAPPLEGRVAQLVQLQRAAGNQAVGRLLERPGRPTIARYGGGHPLANALNMQTPAARAALGEPIFQTLIGWRLGDLSPIVYHATPIPLLQALATSFAGVGSDEMTVLIGALAGPVGVPAFVALTPDRARFLNRHNANLQLAQSMLGAALNDVARADALMQFLAPYIGDPARLAIARQELARLAYDIARTSPVVQFLVAYAGNPVALAAAQQELATAADDTVIAQTQMNILARYNFDRALRAQTETKAQHVATAELNTATQRAATDKNLRYQQAEAAEAQYIEEHRPPQPKKKPTKTAEKKAAKAQTEFKQAVTDAAETRAESETEAAEAEQAAVQAANQQVPVTTANVEAAVQQFIAVTTVSHSAAIAKFVVETVQFDLPHAAAVLPLFTSLAGREGDARTHVHWAFGSYGADLQRLTRAIALIDAADRAHLAVADAQPVVATLMQLRIGDAARARLFAIVPVYGAAWAQVSAFVLTHYATKGDDAVSALEDAHTHTLPLAMLETFGSDAHVFARHAAAHPAFFRAMATWLLQAWPAPYKDLDDLCTLLAPMNALPAPAIDVLVLEQRACVATLRANPAGLAHVIALAATAAPATLRGDLPWYARWFGTHNQPVAGTAAIVTAFPDVHERTRLTPGFLHAGLQARLVADKSAVAADRFAKLARVVEKATSLGSSLDDLEAALNAIVNSYGDKAGELYELLETHSIGSVPRAIVDAHHRGAVYGFIKWVVTKAAGVGSDASFLGHANAYHEYLATDAAVARTIVLDVQRATTTSGTSNDILHVFTVTFATTGGAVTGELHNHVHLVGRNQTSLHFKNFGDKGRELPLKGPLAADCRGVVMAASGGVNTRFPNPYTL
jgi:hypothetical protein